MDIIAHRINLISELLELPVRYGCEIDIRTQDSKLILNHEPYLSGDSLVDYLDNYKHGLLVLNIKEAGIENDVLQLVRERNIPSFFLLDVEFPYLYRASRLGERAIAVRFSEDEPIELVYNYNKLVDWVWVDTNTRLPLTPDIIKQLSELPNTKIILKTGDLLKCKPMCWRFEAIDDDNVEVMMPRDTDTRIFLREKMAVNSRKRVEDYFDWIAIAKQVEDLYASLI